MNTLKLETLKSPERNFKLNTIDIKAIHIAKKNVKEKIKDFGSMFWTVAFPIMMLIVYKLAFTDNGDSMLPGITVFDVEFPGIVVYTIGMSMVTSAVMFSMSKKNGTLERIDTMPVSRGNVFLGAVLSETVFMNLQLLLLFAFGYGALGAHFELSMFFLGYILALVYGVGAIGLGLIIASFLKSPEAANGISMLTHMCLMFTSGSFFPLENIGVFFTPQYWIKQVFLQLTVLGNNLTDKLYGTSIILTTSETTFVPIWGGILMIFAFTAIFIILGVKIFQKKTSL